MNNQSQKKSRRLMSNRTFILLMLLVFILYVVATVKAELDLSRIVYDEEYCRKNFSHLTISNVPSGCLSFFPDSSVLNDK